MNKIIKIVVWLCHGKCDSIVTHSHSGGDGVDVKALVTSFIISIYNNISFAYFKRSIKKASALMPTTIKYNMSLLTALMFVLAVCVFLSAYLVLHPPDRIIYFARKFTFSRHLPFVAIMSSWQTTENAILFHFTAILLTLPLNGCLFLNAKKELFHSVSFQFFLFCQRYKVSNRIIKSHAKSNKIKIQMRNEK